MRLISSILEKEFSSEVKAYPPEDLRRLSQTYLSSRSTFLVAEEGASIVGTCGVKAEGRKTAILRRFFVDSHHRRRGIGSRLLSQALEFCRIQGFQEVVIRTSTQMKEAIRLCISRGFEEHGRWSLAGVTLIRYRLRIPSR